MNMKSKSGTYSGAIFLIGLGLLWLTGWWFPGIFFVIGAASIAGAMANGGDWRRETGALWMFGIGTIFWLNLSWAFIFILIGISIFYSKACGKGGLRKSKSKNDDIDYI